MDNSLCSSNAAKMLKFNVLVILKFGESCKVVIFLVWPTYLPNFYLREGESFPYMKVLRFLFSSSFPSLPFMLNNTLLNIVFYCYNQ